MEVEVVSNKVPLPFIASFSHFPWEKRELEDLLHNIYVTRFHRPKAIQSSLNDCFTRLNNIQYRPNAIAYLWSEFFNATYVWGPVYTDPSSFTVLVNYVFHYLRRLFWRLRRQFLQFFAKFRIIFQFFRMFVDIFCRRSSLEVI